MMMAAEKSELQLLFRAIAQASSEESLRHTVINSVGEYFQAKRRQLFFMTELLTVDLNAFDAVQSKLVKRAMSLDHNPVLRYLVQRHSAVHDEIVLPPGMWRSLCPRSDHAHVLTGPIVQGGQLIGGVALTRDREQGPFDADDVSDLSALCLHMSSRLALLRMQRGAIANFTTAAPLTPREKEIADLVAKGLTNKKIGEQLWITENSVKQALKRMYRKLKVVSRAEMVARLTTADGSITHLSSDDQLTC